MISRTREGISDELCDPAQLWACREIRVVWYSLGPGPIWQSVDSFPLSVWLFTYTEFVYDFMGRKPLWAPRGPQVLLGKAWALSDAKLLWVASLVAQTVKNPPAKPGDTRNTDLIPGPGRSPRERNGYPLQYSCLGNPMDRAAWRATVHGFARDGHNWVTEHTHIHTHKLLWVTSSDCVY